MRRDTPRPGRASPAAVVLAILSVALLVAGGAAACDRPRAYGEANSLIVVAPDSLWVQLEDTTYAALERTVRTVRRERQFRVTQVEPDAEEFEDLKVFHQVVVFGTPGDALVRRVLEAAGRSEAEPPGVVQAEEIWARGQLVTGVLLEPGNEAETWRAQLDEVYRSIDGQYRDFVFRRMYVSGVDTAAIDSLRERFGFRVRVPEVYQIQSHPDRSLVILRNDNPDPSELIRSLTVAWRPRLDTLTAEAAYSWRASLDSLYYNVPQSLSRDTARPPRRFDHHGRPALRVYGTWEDEGDFPAAGPFVDWLVQCADRTFLLDGWLYAPGEDKYQYLLQLQRLMESFRCAGGGGTETGEASAEGSEGGPSN